MTCRRTDKLTYPRRKIAAGYAAQARARTGERITAYHCRRCHCWHIGHPRGWNMPATRDITINCPACEESISLPLSLISRGENEAGEVVIELVPDMGPADAHRCVSEPVVTVQMNHPGIFQVGTVKTDDTTTTVKGWGLTYCGSRCGCHDPLRIDEDQAAGLLGLRQSRRCGCCVPWTSDELAAICRDLSTDGTVSA